MPNMVTTKIGATVGPASCSPKIIGEMIDAGVDVVRLNMSHGTHPDHQRALGCLQQALAERNAHIAVIADLCGPKVRTGPIDPNEAMIAKGDTCEIVREVDLGTARRFATNHPALVDELEPGHRVLIDDGQIRLRVSEKSTDTLICRCESGGKIGSRKGINAPDSELSLSAITEKDKQDIDWAIRHRVDFLALSFVRRADDISQLRDLLLEIGSAVPIIAKIETPQAIDRLDEIIEACDAVLVARGDLGVEMDVTRVPMLQKDMVTRCRVAGKPVIVATQMLQSMILSSTPTRAEVSDVANAALEGADAVMLSAETATGQFPVESVDMMNRICDEVRRHATANGARRSDLFSVRLRVGQDTDRTTSSVARSAAMVAHDLGAKLLAVWSRSGRTARWISKYCMPQPLVCLSANETTCRQLAMSYGVIPKLVSADQAEGREPWPAVERLLCDQFGLTRGDILVTVGDPTCQSKAQTISIRVIGES